MNSGTPAADELQFIDRERIKEAQARVPQCLDDDPGWAALEEPDEVQWQTASRVFRQ